MSGGVGQRSCDGLQDLRTRLRKNNVGIIDNENPMSGALWHDLLEVLIGDLVGQAMLVSRPFFTWPRFEQRYENIPIPSQISNETSLQDDATTLGIAQSRPFIPYWDMQSGQKLSLLYIKKYVSVIGMVGKKLSSKAPFYVNDQ